MHLCRDRDIKENLKTKNMQKTDSPCAGRASLIDQQFPYECLCSSGLLNNNTFVNDHNTSGNSNIVCDLWVSAELNPFYYYSFYCFIVLYYCSFLLYVINVLTIMGRNCEGFSF